MKSELVSMATLSYYHCKRWSYHTIVKLFSISFYKAFIVVATKKRNGNWIRKYCSGSCQVNSSGPNQRLTHNRKGKVEDKWKERVVVKDEKEGIYKVKRSSKRKVGSGLDLYHFSRPNDLLVVERGTQLSFRLHTTTTCSAKMIPF